MSRLSAAVAGPARDIFGISNPYAGVSAGPTSIGGPNVPATSWEPRGTDGRFANSMEKWAKGGNAPKEHGHISLKSVEFLQFQYMCPPVNDGSDLLIMPEMLVFTVNEMPNEEDATIILSLAKLNRIAQEQWDDFVLMTSTTANNPHLDDEALTFYANLRYYGERGLEDYAYAVSHNRIDLLDKYDSAQPILSKKANDEDTQLFPYVTSLRDFWQSSTKEGFCYLTRYGWLQRVNFSGIVQNVNRAVGLEEIDTTESSQHYLSVNVALAKRVRCANVFGSSEHIKTHSTLWITLKRKRCGKGKYGAFQLVPGGSLKLDKPLSHMRNYIDESGAICSGHVWTIGSVLEPPERSPQPTAIEQATNTGYHLGDRASYEAHASLPSFYVALGFKH